MQSKKKLLRFNKLKKDKNEIDIFIDNEISELKDNKQAIKSTLIIPYSETKKDLSFSVFDNDNCRIFYASTRLHDLIKTDNSYEINITGKKNLIGKRFELVEAGTHKVVLKGKISLKKAQVLDLPKKAANEGR